MRGSRHILDRILEVIREGKNGHVTMILENHGKFDMKLDCR